MQLFKKKHFSLYLYSVFINHTCVIFQKFTNIEVIVVLQLYNMIFYEKLEIKGEN